jgi:hypothetical protein
MWKRVVGSMVLGNVMKDSININGLGVTGAASGFEPAKKVYISL